MKVTVIVDGKKYKLEREKIKELTEWLEKYAESVINISEELIIDIEDTKGAELEYAEIQKEEEKNENWSEQSNRWRSWRYC